MDVNAAGIYDPCVNEGKARFKKSFTIGLAYFPNGSIDDWGDLDPCDSSNRSTLTEKGVAISSFRVSVDEMTLLRTSRQDEDGLMETTTPSQATFLSVVAFARGVRSIPRVIRVKSTYPLLLTDFAGKHGRVSSLTLLARFDEGNLEDLQWENVGCGACGGINNLQCLHVGVNATDSRNANYACMLQEDSDCECLATASASAGTCAIAAGSTEALKCTLRYYRKNSPFIPLPSWFQSARETMPIVPLALALLLHESFAFLLEQRRGHLEAYEPRISDVLLRERVSRSNFATRAPLKYRKCETAH